MTAWGHAPSWLAALDPLLPVLLQLVRRTAFVGVLLAGAFVGVRHWGWARRHTVVAGGWHPGQLVSEGAAALRVLGFDAAVALLVAAALHAHGGLVAVFSARGWAAALATLVAVGLWYELWFYALHRLLHTRWGWRWHRQHHTAVVCSPLTAFSFSLVERAGLLLGLGLFAVLGLVGVPLSLPGLLAYVLLNQVLNVLGHSNVALRPIPGGLRWLQPWLVTPTFHALHHARGGAHFGLFTTVLDRACGTVLAEYPAALAGTLAGQPLRAPAWRRPGGPGAAAAAGR